MLNGCHQFAEFGYFNLSELLDIKVGGWLEVLNDPFWIPIAMKDIGLARETRQLKSIQKNRSST
jgi:hypothetical protein